MFVFSHEFLEYACIGSFFVSFFLFFPLNADYSSGFGGKYGVQADRVDKSAVGFDYQGKTEKHESQKGEHGFLF